MSILEKGISILKEIGKIPDLKQGIINEVKKKESGVEVSIQGIWKIKNYTANENNTLSSLYSYRSVENEVYEYNSTVMDKRVVLSAQAPALSKSAILLQNTSSRILLLLEGQQSYTINLMEEDVHGMVNTDELLASFCWSSDSKYIAYVAERKQPKASSFLSKQPDGDKLKGWGKKYSYLDDWGEQLTGYYQSVVVIVDTDSHALKVMECPDDYYMGQVVWTPENTILGVGYPIHPFKLGLKYCTNRESFLFYFDTMGKFVKLEEGMHVQTPRFSPDGSHLVFLRGPVGGPHVRACQLCLMNWKNKEVTVVIDYVSKFINIVNNKSFYGLYGSSNLPLRCWSEDNKEVVFSTCNNFSTKTYIVNTESKEIRQVPDNESNGYLDVFDVKDNYILGSCSSLTDPPRIVLIPLIPNYPKELSEVAIFISRANHVEGIQKDWKDQWTFVNPNPHPVDAVSNSPVPAIYFGPKEDAPGSSKRPLIVWPHGGPHSILQNKFEYISSFFVRMGYSILIPNYRGSLGQGREALESLPGHCGKTDVDDVHQALLQCLQRYKSVVDENKVVLFGGSHGGFLVTHLSAQYPDMSKAVSARNPVIDIASMSTSTDITDWNFTESGDTYEKGKNLSGEIFTRMFNMSPLSLIDAVKTPTLMLLGNEDRRVPMSQGSFYYKMLLARKVPTKLFVYDDCHALSKSDVEADALLQTILWYDQYL